MAAWQFDIHLVPCGTYFYEGDSERDGDGEREYDFSELWKGRRLPNGYEQWLDRILPWSPPWDPDWKIFGSEEGTRVDVLTEGEHIEEVRLRLDARALEPELLEQLMTFVRDMGCELVTPSGRLVAPDPLAIWVELELSPAVRFVRDPKGFLDSYQRYVSKPYEAQYPVGTRVCIRERSELDRFAREWKYHHSLTADQLAFAGVETTVKDVGFYHGGDSLYQLEGVPGVWHEQCLAPG